MNWAFALFLVLHVGGAIFAFGPTLVFPLLGSMVGKEPMHGNFGLRLGELIEKRLIVPLAILQAITGIGLIWTLPANLFDGAHWWLIIGIVLYVIAMIIVFTNQLPVTHELIEMTKNPPPPPAPGTAPMGPPPQLLALVKRNQMGGQILTVLLVVIIILMVLGSNGFLT